MAQRKQIAQERKEELTKQLAEARQSISHGRKALKSQLQLKKQLRRFVISKPKALFAGSVATGLVLTLLLKRPRSPRKAAPKTTRQILLGWGFSLVKPAAKAWLITRAKKIAAERINPLKSARPTKQASNENEETMLDSW